MTSRRLVLSGALAISIALVLPHTGTPLHRSRPAALSTRRALVGPVPSWVPPPMTSTLLGWGSTSIPPTPAQSLTTTTVAATAPTPGTSPAAPAPVTWQQLTLSLPWNGQLMIQVAYCESTDRPTAVNGRSYGLFQQQGETSSDPLQQVRDAYALWQVQGYGAWEASRPCWG